MFGIERFLDNVICDQFFYITILRDPLTRLVSHHAFELQEFNKVNEINIALKDDVRNIEPYHVLRWSYSTINNYYIRTLLGYDYFFNSDITNIDKKAYNLALKKLKQFDLVLILEHRDQLKYLLKPLLGWDFILHNKDDEKNQSFNQYFSKNDQKLLKKHNKWDIKLYNKAKNIENQHVLSYTKLLNITNTSVTKEVKETKQIRVIYRGRLGNRLLQYTAALVKSIEDGYSIKNPLDTNITKSFDFKIESTEKYIEQDGYFQDDEDIKKLIKYKSQIFRDVKEQDGIIIHLRLGDLLNAKWAKFDVITILEYIEKALLRVDKIDGYITTDSPDHNITTHLINKYNLKLYENDPEETILFGSSFKNKILTTGTFSWFIGFLGSQHNVIYPEPNTAFGYNAPAFKPTHWNMIKLTEHKKGT